MKKDVEKKTETIDILMVSLAVFSILLVIVDLTIDLPENQRNYGLVMVLKLMNLHL